MSDGHGCDPGAHHCGHGIASAGSGDAGYMLGSDGQTPVPNHKHVTINGAPVTETSHEFVMPAPVARFARRVIP